MADDSTDTTKITIRILCPKHLHIPKPQPSTIQWLIGSPFLPSFTIISTLTCIHSDFSKESDEIRALLPKGFEVIGALIVGTANAKVEVSARDAIDASGKMRKALCQLESCSVVGGVLDPGSGEIRFFVLNSVVEPVSSVVYEDEPEKYVWERGCVLYCELPVKLPVYYKDSKVCAQDWLRISLNPKKEEDMDTIEKIEKELMEQEGARLND